MNPDATLKAARAIASAMVERYMFLPFIVFTASTFVLFILSFLLVAYFSGWWILLTFMLLTWLVLGIFATLITFAVFSKLRPRVLKKSEKHQITTFVSDFGVKYAAAKGIKKSPTALSALVAWKYVKERGKQPISAVVMEPINESRVIKARFQDIVKLFSN